MKYRHYSAVRAGLASAALFACLGALTPIARAQERADEDLMSAMGQLGQQIIAKNLASQPSSGGGNNQVMGSGDAKGNANDGVAQDELTVPALGGQAETSVSVDSTGQHVVFGFNDTRGFNVSPQSVSGFMYSDDGGQTFTDGGQLPSVAGSTVLGDPEIVYMGGANFIYASIFIKNGTTQTMCVHYSKDYGHTWKGPFEIPSATNPAGIAGSADKEFLHRDPDTGRVMMSWSHFRNVGGVDIRTTYSDDILTAMANNVAPTWSTSKLLVNSVSFGQGVQSSIPRFQGNGSNNVVVVWRTTVGAPFSFGNEARAVSTDNGDNWSVAANLRPAHFLTMDQVLGNDRINNSPSLAVHDATGNYYAVYADDTSHDGADIALQKSTNGGVTWSAPVYVNARPGNDRAQWFPWVTVDQSTGRIHVFYYDQGIDTSGDLTEVSHTYSDDGGTTWSPAAPISERPFQAGFGNDTGQPNIGDYNQGVTLPGEFMATFAYTPTSIDFQQGQPSGGMNWPDVGFARRSAFNVALRLGAIGAFDSSGDNLIDPGETLMLQVPLQSYANNAPTYTGVNGVLTTTTPGVTIQAGSSSYPDVPNGGSSTNTFNYVAKLSPSFVPGTTIEFKLAVTTASGNAALLFSQRTGQPVKTTLYSTDFNTDAGGFTTAHGGGANTVAWTLSTTAFTAAPFNTNGTRSLFHINANDGVGGTGNPTRWERAIGPVITVPANASYAEVEFDVAYNSEDEPTYNIYAWDGFFLRITDNTGGSFLLRSVLAEAFAQDFMTGTSKGYPKHLPRNSSTSYFEDMACWAGYSNGWKHVSMKLPGVAGTKIQLRFEYAQDSGGFGSNAAYPTKGVAVDNIVVKSVQLVNPPNAAPIANAGADQTVECAGEFTDVTLDGSASSDPDGEPISYEWYQGATLLGTGQSITVSAPHHATTTYTLKVTDAHSNSSTDTVDVKIQDTIAPQVTLVGPAVIKIFCEDPFVDPGATSSDICDGDLTSGIVVSGSVGPGVGTYTVTYKSKDDAGNIGTATRTVKVIYQWTNLLQPVNTDGSSIFKLNSTIPLKFNLTGNCADDVITAKVFLTKITNNVLGSEVEAVSTSAADTGNVFRRSSGQYIYNLATKGLSTGTWQIRVDLGDGELHTVLISLK